MGFSPGNFPQRGTELHWEGKGTGDIVLWDKYEAKAILWLTKEEARAALDQLALLVQMAEEGRL